MTSNLTDSSDQLNSDYLEYTIDPYATAANDTMQGHEGLAALHNLLGCVSVVAIMVLIWGGIVVGGVALYRHWVSDFEGVEPAVSTPSSSTLPRNLSKLEIANTGARGPLVFVTTGTGGNIKASIMGLTL